MAAPRTREVAGRHVHAARERDVQGVGLLPVDPVADAPQCHEVAQVLGLRWRVRLRGDVPGHLEYGGRGYVTFPHRAPKHSLPEARRQS